MVERWGSMVSAIIAKEAWSPNWVMNPGVGCTGVLQQARARGSNEGCLRKITISLVYRLQLIRAGL